MNWKKEYSDMLDVCFENEHLLNDWERDFVQSILDALDEDFEPTPRQIDKLLAIHDKVA